MNQIAATDFIAKTFNSKFDDQQFEQFVANLLNKVDRSKAFRHRSGNYIPQKFRGHISTYRRPFVYYDPNGDRLDVLIVKLHKESNLERARTMQRNFAADYLKKNSDETIEAALIAFYHEDVDDWRFSLVKLEYAFGDEGFEERLTPARRYSFLVGPTEPTHTAEEQLRPFLINDAENPTIEQLTAAFQIETVSKKFFTEYKGLFLELVEGVEAVIKADKRLADDFERANIHVPNFTKKLLGQIVFLYFVQKKGWMGVGAGKKWGSGSKDFLRRLFEKKDGVAYDNFFNDVLEPLFYDALAVRRADDLFDIGGCQCKIPFLNGGLFEPMGGYDWAHTKLLLPNSLFSNRQNAEDDEGTGILDVFDRYNFTVWEEEPLEKEVAVDPEMLGKVFENLLEVQDRKSKGAFYTPREIVHYMCQESLINYLNTAVGGEEKGTVSREEIGVLVRQGALALQHDAAKEAGLKKDAYILPANVRGHAAALDTALADIKICDPAIGSGAFPVGMLHEIVQARLALDTQLKNVPTPYQLKRHAIQESIYGVDIDDGAVEIAKLRLWLSLVVDEESYDNIQPLPNLDYKIVRGNSLLGVEKDLFNLPLFAKLDKLKREFFEETHRQEKIKLKAQIDQLIDLLTDGNSTFDFEVYFHEVFAKQGGFDVVIGNPPYVFSRGNLDKAQKTILKSRYSLTQFKINLYILFIEKAFSLLRANGNLAYITPNNWLTLSTTSNLRNFILTKTFGIKIILNYDNVFEGASVDTCTLIFNKSGGAMVFGYEWAEQGVRLLSSQKASRYLQNPGHIISNINLNSDIIWSIIEKVDLKSKPLLTVAEVRNGVQAYTVGEGKPIQTKEMKEERIYHSTFQEDKDWVKYLDGVDVSRYCVGWSGQYIKYGENLSRQRTPHLFKGERLLVRQILKRPPYCIHCCYTDEETINDNNSMVVLGNSDEMHIKYIMGILNSKLISYWFMHKFGKLQRKIFPQFKVNELRMFPIANTSYSSQQPLVSLVDRIIKAKCTNSKAEIFELDKEIDELVYQLYDLSDEEITIVEGVTNE